MQNQTTHHKGKQEERQVGRQAGRQEGRQAGRQRRQRRQNIGKVDTPSNTGKQEGRQGGDKTSGKWTRVGDKGRQDQGEYLKNALRTPRAVHCLEDKKGDNVEIMWREGARCLGRRTHQPTKGNKKGYRRRQKETRPLAKGKTLRKADAPSNKGKQEGVQWETRPSERRTHHPQRETVCPAQVKSQFYRSFCRSTLISCERVDVSWLAAGTTLGLKRER